MIKGALTLCSKISSVLCLTLLSACSVGKAGQSASDFFKPPMVELLSLIQQGEVAKAKRLMAASALDLNIHGEEGITPLMWLLMVQDDKNGAKLALKLKADPNFKIGSGSAPVALIAGSDDPERLALLLEAGGDPNSLAGSGKPALFGAIGQRRMADIETLLKNGADVNLVDGSNRNSALYATYIMNFELAYYFIKRDADIRLHSSTGSDLAWRVHRSLSKEIIAPGNPNYAWVMKVKQHLIDNGITFPPPSPSDVRERLKKEGRYEK